MANTHLQSRRQFLKTTASAAGITLLGFHLPTASAGSETFEPNAFLIIEPHGGITVKICQAELGQGISTGLAMALAEELEVPLQQIRYEFAAGDAAYNNRKLSPGEQVTGGSRSVQAFFDTYRRAGASARDMLIRAAAGEWGVPTSQCAVRQGVVVHSETGREARFSDLATSAARLEPPAEPLLKPRSQFRLVGTAAQRIDTREKTDATAVFGIDVKVSDMAHAAIKHAPVVGGDVIEFDATAARKQPGVIEIARLPGAIAVVAEHYWQAAKALESVEVEFSLPATGGPSSNDVEARLTTALNQPEAPVARDGGSARSDIAASKETVEATYRVPYLAHATLEPINATVSTEAGRASVWAPTQAPTRARNAAASALGLAPEQVTVYPTHVGGGFGVKGRSDVVTEAALLSRAVGRPVKVIWSREEDMQQDFYRPAYAAQLKAVLSEQGKPAALQARISGSGPINYFRPDLIKNGVDPISTRDLVDLWYDIEKRHVETVEVAPPVRVGFWRSTGASQNVFFAESFIDECAHASSTDPVELRRQLLKHDPRSLAVLNLAVEKAGWGQNAPDTAHGIAFFASPRWKCRVALVAELAKRGNAFVPSRMVCAADIGLAVNPAIARDQLEGAIIFGLTAALYGEITVADGAVQQSNYHDYPMLRMAQTPAIETYLIEGESEPGSVGEIGVPAVAPALANALFAATGRRERSLPLRNFSA